MAACLQLIAHPVQLVVDYAIRIHILLIAGTKSTELIPSLVFVVQSSVVDPVVATSRAEACIDSFEDKLEKLPAKDFQDFITGLVSPP